MDITNSDIPIGHKFASNHELVNGAISLLERLHDILETEQHLMKVRDTEALVSQLSEKQNLLDVLLDIEERLKIELQTVQENSTGLTPATESTHKLIELMRSCHILNKDNQDIVSVELKNSRDSLDFLRNLMQMNDLSLYGDKGQLSISREKRYLGSV